jgi:O-antigen/teichoic acid export membrane protein
MSKSQILIRNTFYNFLSYIWFAILTFIFVPYIVKKLGYQAYGVLAIATVFIAYFALLDFGFGWSITKYISEYLGRAEEQQVQDIINTGMAIFIIASLGGSSLIIFLTPIFIRYVLNIPQTLINASYFVFYVGALGFFFNMIFGMYGSILQALQRFDVLNKIKICRITLSFSLAALLLKLGFYLKAVVILYTFIAFLNCVIFFYITKKLLPQFNFKPKIKLKTLKKMAKFGSAMISANIFSQINEKIDRLLIGIYLPVNRITFYSIPFNLGYQMQVIAISISRIIMPAVSEFTGTGGKEGIVIQLYLRATKYVLTILIPLCFLALSIGDKFLLYWMDIEFARKSSFILRILSLAFLIFSTTFVGAATIQGRGRPFMWVKFMAFVTLFNLMLCTFLVPKFGTKGASVALLIYSVVLSPLFLNEINKKILKISNLTLLKYSIVKPLVLGLVFFLGLFFLRPYAVNLFNVIAISIIAILCYLALSYFLTFDRKDREAIKSYYYSFFGQQE